MCKNFEILQALAQDKLAAGLAPALHVADLLVGEDRLGEEWRVLRAEAAATASEDAAKLASDQAGEIRKLRHRLHIAALRRLDAAATGREVFLPCPAYFGEPYMPYKLAPDLLFRAGIVRRANYWPTTGGEMRSRIWRADRNLVSSAESKLLPLFSVQSPAEEDFAAAATAWLGMAALRDFEARSPLPLFPYATIFPDGYVPPGFRVRIRPETMRALGGSYLTLAAAGISPYIAEPFYDYCAQRGEQLAADREDVVGLAAAKWGGFPIPLAHEVLQSRS
jgi:hypothetical protein